MTADAAERIITHALDLRDAGRVAEALPLLRQATRDHSLYPRLWQTLGVLHRGRQESAAAVEAFARAAALAPGEPRIAHSHAQASLEAGYPAIALFDRARLTAPADGDLLIGRAAAQLAEGQVAQAITDLDTVLAGNPLWLDGHQTLARLRWLAGERRDHLASYRRALATAPATLALWTAMIDLQLQTRRFAEADAAIAEARRATGADLDAFEATTASELRDDRRAERLFARFASLASVPLAVRHTRHLLRTGRADEAAARADPLLGDAEADQLWPYAGLAWRLLDDPRWRWLDRDGALVRTYDLSPQIDLAALAARLRALHAVAGMPAGQSVVDGTQTDGPLFARAEPEIVALREAVAAIVASHVASLGPRDIAHPVLRHLGPGAALVGSWSVSLPGGGGHHDNHLHPAGWLSSALHVVVPDAAALGPAPAGSLLIGAPPAELGLNLAPTRIIPPRAGQIVLFPAISWHGTAPFAHGERLSVAFDVTRPPGGA